jgi:hypothetical protein
VALSRNNPFPIFNGVTRPVVTTYDNWRGAIQGEKFDPNRDRFLNRSAFPVQPSDQFGNVTRYNPKVRGFAPLNESITLAKTFTFRESFRLDLRGEAFNVFNRTVFSTGTTNLDSNAFGIVSTQANAARQMQLALKLYW